VGPQRIVSVTYSPNETQVELSEDFNPARMLAAARRRVRGRRRAERRGIGRT
jgi:hypothetical protein